MMMMRFVMGGDEILPAGGNFVINGESFRKDLELEGWIRFQFLSNGQILHCVVTFFFH